jgi:prepilin-type N-terminal cleavage/methylation domain-containing protein
MKRALRIYGAPAMAGMEGGCIAARRTRAFTLLEMCIVMFIMAVLAAISMPAFQSAVNEHKVREDGHQLAIMVRTAMIQSNEQHRAYVIDLSTNAMWLHPLEETTNDAAAASDAALFKDSGSTTNADNGMADTATPDVKTEQTLTDGNKVQQPDLTKTDKWINLPDEGEQWVFQPGELCPATNVRIARGDAYLEMDFQALTGDVDSEKSYFP